MKLLSSLLFLSTVSLWGQSLPDLGRGINLGNALEAPTEGYWGVRLEESYFSTIAKAGFTTVRVPIRWNAHALPVSPWTIEPNFFQRVDWVVAQAQKNHLRVILDFHNFDELLKNPAGEEGRFLSIWQQIADHYKSTPTDQVFFELFNEPHDITPDVWNGLIVKALAVIRPTNPDRPVVVGPLTWNSISALPTLTLPDSDQHLIVTVHFYEPFHFTHQGAEWVDGSTPWLGTMWMGTQADKDFIHHLLGQAADWGKVHHRPIFVGEFGAYSKGDMDSRARWTTEVARTAEADGMGWAYWEFCSGFGAYDPAAKAWRPPLLTALIPPN